MTALKRYSGLGLAIIVCILFYFLPVPNGLTRDGLISLGYLLACLVLWVSECLPIGISSLLAVGVMVLTGVVGINEAMQQFMSTAVMFVLATFSITVALANTSIPQRVIARLLRITGPNPGAIILGFMILNALLSSIMSTVAAIAIFVGLSMALLDACECEPGKSNFGRAMMICLPYGGTIGGCMTPAGTPINVFAINALQENCGITVSFLDWMLMGIPFAVIMLPFVWFIVTLIYKPEPISDTHYKKILEVAETYSAQALTSKEVKTVVIVLATIALWILSTWLPFLNITVIAILCLVVMHLPGIEVLTFEQYAKGVSWGLILFLGSVSVLIWVVGSTGASTWLITAFIPEPGSLSNVMLLAAASAVLVLVRFVIPMGSVIPMLAFAPMIALAVSAGANPVTFVMMVVFIGVPELLLPLDACPQVSYEKGFYTMFDMFKTGVVPTLSYVAYCSILLPIFVRMAGF